MNPVFGQEEMESTAELEQEMAAQRAEYQKLIKKMGAEELIDDPKILNMFNSGAIDFDRLENTVRNLQKKRAQATLGKVGTPSMTDLFKGDAGAQVGHLIAPLKNISEDQLKKNLVNNLQEGRAKLFLKRSPKVQTFLAKLLKDEKALPSFARILDNKNKLYTFFFINVTIFILLKLRKMIINRKNRNSKFYKKSLTDSFFGWVMTTTIILAIRL